MPVAKVFANMKMPSPTVLNVKIQKFSREGEWLASMVQQWKSWTLYLHCVMTANSTTCIHWSVPSLRRRSLFLNEQEVYFRRIETNLTFAFAHAAKLTKPKKEDLKELNDAIQFALLNKYRQLIFMTLDIHFVSVCLYRRKLCIKRTQLTIAWILNFTWISIRVVMLSSAAAPKSKRIARSALSEESFA